MKVQTSLADVVSHSQTIQSAFSPRNNSLTFIRLCLAVMVILSHSYDLGGFGGDPFKQYCDITIGEVAVNGFFAISGYLITTSFIKSRSTLRYSWKRLIRIFPGYWACLATTALVLAPVLYFAKYDQLPLAGNLISNPFIDYVKANFWLRINQQGIHNIFLDNPAQGVFNGSLWTLFPELLCYFLVVFLGQLGCLKDRRRFVVLVSVLICSIIHALSPQILTQMRSLSIYGSIWYLLQLNSLGVYFLSGASLFLWSHRIPFGNRSYYVALLLFSLCLLSKSYLFFGPLILPYVLIGLSIKIPFSGFHQFGDYSYGLYLYAYPIQQTLFSLNMSTTSPTLFFVISTLATFPFAWLSWHLIERNCLKLKSYELKFS